MATTTPNAIRIWIGTETKTRIPCKVLQHSILRCSPNQNIEFITPEWPSWEAISDATNGAGTGFSLARWQIPESLQWAGKCLYLDADQLVFHNISDLWNIDLIDGRESVVYCTFQVDKWYNQPAPNTSVMLINCELAKECSELWAFHRLLEYLKTDSQRKRYVEVMHAQHLKIPACRIPDYWNHLNTFVDGQTRLLHYTKEPEQPWYYPGHRNKNSWRDALVLALQDGYIEKQEIRDACANFRKHTAKVRGTGMHPYWLKFVK